MGEKKVIVAVSLEFYVSFPLSILSGTRETEETILTAVYDWKNQNRNIFDFSELHFVILE